MAGGTGRSQIPGQGMGEKQQLTQFDRRILVWSTLLLPTRRGRIAGQALLDNHCTQPFIQCDVRFLRVRIGIGSIWLGGGARSTGFAYTASTSSASTTGAQRKNGGKQPALHSNRLYGHSSVLGIFVVIVEGLPGEPAQIFCCVRAIVQKITIKPKISRRTVRAPSLITVKRH